VKAYLQLIRAPNLFTAAADAAAGFTLMAAVDGTLDRPHWLRLAALMAISAALYASGVVFNDCLDADKDRAHRPDRPIPSGAVPLPRAFLLGALLTCGALLAAMFLGLVTVLYATLLVIAIWLYNGAFRRWAISGALGLGLCRFLNMQLGMSTGMSLRYFSVRNYPELLLAPALLGAYAAIVTLVSTYEDRPAGRSGAWLLLGSAAAMCMVLLGALLGVVGTISGQVVLGALILALAAVLIAPLVRLTFASVRKAVGMAVVLVIAFDAAIVLGVRDAPLWLGLGVLLSLVPAALLARKLSPS
jgi:4-hydroxybenzoate polyprenyltransferase